MIIYRDGVEILSAPVHGVESNNLTSHIHTYSFDFEKETLTALKKGDNVSFGGAKFILLKDYIPKINTLTNGFIYTLDFYSEVERWNDYIVKYDGETDFNLTTSGTNHLKLIADNLEASGFGVIPYLGIDAQKPINYKDISLIGALDLIAKTYEVEWWFDGALHIGKYEHGEPIVLEYDKELNSISYTPSEAVSANRIYVYGGNRNMAGGKRLTLDAPVDAFPLMKPEQVIEGVRYNDNIYPRQKNVITHVSSRVIEAEDRDKQDTTIFTFSDENGLKITKDELLSDVVFRVIFEDGALSGREFELIITESGNYEIIYEQEGDNYVPNPTLAPKIGDPFVLFGFDATKIEDGGVMSKLVADAKAELLADAKEYLSKRGHEYVYDVETRSIHCEKNSINLSIGQRVILKSPMFADVASRVQGYEKDVLNPYKAKYLIGNTPEYSRVGNLEKLAEKTEYNVQTATGITSEYAQYLIAKEGAKHFLSKVADDISRGKITFNEGLDALRIAKLKGGVEFGSFNSGIHGTGRGGGIDEKGNAELESLVLRSFLEVPELRYNQLTLIGEEVAIGAGGVIETVTPTTEGNYDITLKLEEGEMNPFAPLDIVKGIFHHENGFGTTWFSINTIEKQAPYTMNVSLRAGNAYPPKPFMNIARWGNFEDAERQSVIILSAKNGNIVMYDNIDNYDAGRVASQWGRKKGLEFLDNFEDLPIGDNDAVMYLRTLLYEDLIQVDYKGNVIREYRDRGVWSLETAINDPYQSTTKLRDEVWVDAEKFRCIFDSTQQKPTRSSPHWVLILSLKDEIISQTSPPNWVVKAVNIIDGAPMTIARQSMYEDMHTLTAVARITRNDVDVTSLLAQSPERLYEFQRVNIYGVDDVGLTDAEWNILNLNRVQVTLTHLDVMFVANLQMVYDTDLLEKEYQRLK